MKNSLESKIVRIEQIACGHTHHAAGNSCKSTVIKLHNYIKFIIIVPTYYIMVSFELDPVPSHALYISCVENGKIFRTVDRPDRVFTNTIKSTFQKNEICTFTYNLRNL